MGIGDEAFVVKTFIESSAMSHSWAGVGHFADRFHNRYLGLVRRSRALVAAFEEDPEHILGFALGSDKAVIFAYVRRAQRQMGLGRLMVEALGFREPVRCGVWTRVAEQIGQTHQLVFSPYECGTEFELTELEKHGKRKTVPGAFAHPSSGHVDHSPKKAG